MPPPKIGYFVFNGKAGYHGLIKLDNPHVSISSLYRRLDSNMAPPCRKGFTCPAIENEDQAKETWEDVIITLKNKPVPERWLLQQEPRTYKQADEVLKLEEG